mmetsp:Transcript_1689/g.2985  ORF Transcript_1689/g.2985 Transcript_1689/m.2985 type:complete len:243 (+) Transcript_1689:21-749(+)
MQALPLTKLAGLMVKTIAKPLSKRIKHDFSRFQVTQKILIGIGQASHRVTSRLTIWSAGYRVRSITPLEPDKAMKVGAEFVGEAFVFAVSGGIVVWEYNRSRESTAEKNAKIQKEARLQREALQAKLKTLDVRLQAIEEVMKSNSQFPLHFGKVYVPPSDTVPIEDEADALPVTADLEEATVTTKAEEGTEEKSSDASKVPVMKTTTASPKERSNLQTRLTKMQAEEQEKQSIWERFVWRPW